MDRIEKKSLIFAFDKAYIFPLWYRKPHVKIYGNQSKCRGRPLIQVLDDFEKINNNNSLGAKI